MTAPVHAAAVGTIVLITGLGMFGTGGQVAAGDLRIRVVDQAGRPVWTRLEVRDSQGNMHRPPSALHDRTAGKRADATYYLDSFVVNGATSVDVPPGRYTVIAEHGLEYERVEKTVEVRDAGIATVAIRMRPWIRMRDRGFFSGDLHVHRPEAEMTSLALAEDINISVAFTMWNRRRGEPVALPVGRPVIQASPHHLVTMMNAEDEREGGAWMLHGIPRSPGWRAQGVWYPPGINYVRWARSERGPGGVLPWFDCEKPIWWEVPVLMALEPPDSFGVLHNHFNQYGIHATEAWGPPRDPQQYPGRQGFVDYSLGLYYRFLNLGRLVPPSAGSASGVLPNPVGYNRVYVPLTGRLTVQRWYQAMRDSRTFVTNGPMLFATMTGTGVQRWLDVEAIAREPIDRVEIIGNGEIIESHSPPAAAQRIKRRFRVDADAHSWVAVRCFLKTPDTVRLAHSSPFALPGSWDASKDAGFFVGWMDRLISETKAHPERLASDSERKEILGLYLEARAFYAQRAEGKR